MFRVLGLGARTTFGGGSALTCWVAFVLPQKLQKREPNPPSSMGLGVAESISEELSEPMWTLGAWAGLIKL